MNEDTATAPFALLAGGEAFDPVEDGVRQQVRRFIETILEEELQTVLGRGRYERSGAGAAGHRNGHRERQIIGTFGAETVKVPRARLVGDDGRAREWRSQALRRYQRLTKKAEALIAAVYLAGTNTRRVRRALIGLFDGAVSNDVVSRAWRKVKTDWQAWCARSLAEEDIVRLILDGSVVKARIDRKATAIKEDRSSIFGEGPTLLLRSLSYAPASRDTKSLRCDSRGPVLLPLRTVPIAEFTPALSALPP